MFIELEPIFNVEGTSKAFVYEFKLDDCDIIDTVSVSGEVKNNTGIVSLKGNAVCRLNTVCDRCAAPVKREMTVPLNHLLIAHLNDEDNDDFILVEDMNFNLDELVREDIFLSMPAKVLCRPDCKGLCQYCGANLNDGSCNCKKPVDPRLAVLSQLLEEE